MASPVFLLPLMLQVVVQSGEGMAVEQKVDLLAHQTAATVFSLVHLFDDPAVRDEMKRTGLDHGCAAATAITRSMPGYTSPALLAFASQAVADTIAEPELEAMTHVTFLLGTGSKYKSRVTARFEKLAQGDLARFRATGQQRVLGQLRQLPDEPVDSATEPPLAPVIARSLGADAGQVWNSANLMALACYQRVIPREQQPTITHNGESYPPSGDKK